MVKEIDHYAVLGLPHIVASYALDVREPKIKEAYRSKVKVVHPDKMPDDPDANAKFCKLNTSYEFLMGEIKEAKERAKLQRQTPQDSKRRKTMSKMMSDLEERERRAHESDPELKAKFEEEKINRKLQEGINRIRAQFTKKGSDVPAYKKNGTSGVAPRNVEPSDSNLSNLVGSGHQAFEHSVLEKLKKAAEKQESKISCCSLGVSPTPVELKMDAF